MSESTKWLDDVFGIPADGSNIDDDSVQDNAYTEVGKGANVDKFDAKASQIREASASPVAADVEYVDKIEPIAKVEIAEKPKPTPAAKSVVLEPVAEPAEETEEDRAEEPSEPVPFSLPSAAPGEWSTSYPNPKFNNFYAYKKELVDKLHAEGLLPFAKYQNELKQAFVPIANEGMDLALTHKQMEKIQGWRDRVTQITLEVEPQLFWWKRGVEEMRGLLAMTQYEKPKEKQEGMNFLHLRDMEQYLSKLEGLQSNCISVMKNLGSAYETLSRQLTIMMPQHEIVRYGTPQHPAPFVPNKVSPPKSSENLKDFDTLSSEDKSVKESSNPAPKPITNEERKVKKTSWNDIGKKR